MQTHDCLIVDTPIRFEDYRKAAGEFTCFQPKLSVVIQDGSSHVVLPVRILPARLMTFCGQFQLGEEMCSISFISFRFLFVFFFYFTVTCSGLTVSFMLLWWHKYWDKFCCDCLCWLILSVWREINHIFNSLQHWSCVVFGEFTVLYICTFSVYFTHSSLITER